MSLTGDLLSAFQTLFAATPASANAAATSWSNALGAISSWAGGGAPSGLVMDYAGSVVPAGYLLCDGSAVPQATYPGLWAALGTTWGTSAGNVVLPDLRNFWTVGAGSTYALAATGGAASVTSGSESSHTHSVTSNVTVAANTGSEATHTHSVTSNVTVAANTGTEAAHTHPLTGTGAGAAILVSATNIFSRVGSVTGWTATVKATTTNSADTTPETSGAVLVGSTAAGSSHSHTSGALTNNAVTSGAGASHSHTSGALTNNAVTSGAGASHSHTSGALTNNAVASGAGASHSHSVATLPPYQALFKIIKT